MAAVDSRPYLSFHEVSYSLNKSLFIVPKCWKQTITLADNQRIPCEGRRRQQQLRNIQKISGSLSQIWELLLVGGMRKVLLS